MLEKGWIKSSLFPYGSPILFIAKKTSKLRKCIDFYALKANMIGVFTLTCIGNFLDKLGKVKLFSSIELTIAYQQVRIA